MSPPYSFLAHLFLEIRTQIKIYHWTTRSYARHKATDRFVETFEPLVDRFVEAAQGIAMARHIRGASRIDSRVDKKNFSNIKNFSGPVTDTNAPNYLIFFRSYMEKLELPESELAQIRDDILEITDVTLYLFSLE